MPDLLVVFDLDGTLVDSSAEIHGALRVALAAILAEQESPQADEAAVKRGCHGLPLEVFFRRARPRASAQTLHELAAAYRRHYDQHLLHRTRPFPGVIEGLSRLQALRHPHLRLAVATTKPSAVARLVTDGLGLTGFFAEVQGSDGLPYKPDPAVLHALFARLGGRPRLGVMVGDTDHDIHAGRAAGLRTCAVGWSEVPGPLAEAAPDHHARTFAEVVELVIRMAGL